jgi:hypothetical protein
MHSYSFGERRVSKGEVEIVGDEEIQNGLLL